MEANPCVSQLVTGHVSKHIDSIKQLSFKLDLLLCV